MSILLQTREERELLPYSLGFVQLVHVDAFLGPALAVKSNLRIRGV